MNEGLVFRSLCAVGLLPSFDYYSFSVVPFNALSSGLSGSSGVYTGDMPTY